ncbi:MAG: AraC family transcriptional regulator ligand-binding domain-containing protein [Hoeflea sp.]|uniref:AraC family transcriptional regulator n=1 Tax=Hoeflea sp. TaxID=1940281 RepID=UPI002730B98F|nr:AraC family transcriptional regulator [Hoeflea sp.]MDP2120335.1 AraC family transcriptional regulator ligand-binding domain-containing protein [Hoeflea sp.]
MKSTLADQFEVAAGLASGVSRYAASIGIDAGPIAHACGLDPERFNIIGERVSLDRVCRFMEALAMICGDDQFGLKSAAEFQKGASGPFGYAMMNAATVRDCLVFMGRNLSKISETSICTLEFGPRAAHFEWTYSPLILHRAQFVDLGVAQTFNHLRAFLGDEVSRIRVELERKKPINTNLHKQLLTPLISFGAQVNTLILPAEILGRSNPAADPRLFTMMSQQMEAMPQRNTDAQDPVAAVRLHVAENLSSTTLTLAREAERLGMSSRTLQRRLTEAGTSMQAIVDDCRKEMAGRLLLETNLTLSSIGYKLGFSAPAAFTRSAIRWFGKTPSEVRKHHRKPV